MDIHYYVKRLQKKFTTNSLYLTVPILTMGYNYNLFLV